LQLLRSPIAEAAQLPELPGYATICADFSFCETLSSSQFSLLEGNCAAELQFNSNTDRVNQSKLQSDFWRLPSVATWFCSSQGVQKNKESPLICLLGSTVFESGCNYFEISSQFISSGAPPAVGIVDASSESYDIDVFSGVAITIADVDGSRQLSGSFASQGSTNVARSGDVRSRHLSVPNIPGSNSQVTVRVSFCCLP
jgi:hypothetical protein